MQYILIVLGFNCSRFYNDKYESSTIASVIEKSKEVNNYEFDY